MEEKLLNILELLNSFPVFSGVHVTRWIVVCPFSLAIVLSILLLFTDSGYPFGIFVFFLFCYP